MVFVRTDEDDRPLFAQQFGERFVVEYLLDVLPCRRGQRDTDNLLQFIDRTGGPATHRNDPAVATGIDRILDGLFRLFQQVGHGASADIVLGMGIGVDALLVLNELAETSAEGESGEFLDQNYEHAADAASLPKDARQVSQVQFGVSHLAQRPAKQAFPQEYLAFKRKFTTAASVDQLLADSCFMEELKLR